MEGLREVSAFDLNEDDIISFKKDYRDDVIQITWRMTMACNYRCSYCVQDSRADEKSLSTIQPDEFYLKIAKKLNDIIEAYEGDKVIELKYIGGEVTQIPCFLDILRTLSSKKIMAFNIVTNGSKSAEYYSEIIKIANANKQRPRFVFSWHEEHVSLDRYIQLLKDIKNNPDNTNSSLMSEIVICKYNLDSVYKFIERCKELDIRIVADVDMYGEEFELPEDLKKNKSIKKYSLVTLKSGEIVRATDIENKEFSDRCIFLCDYNQSIDIEYDKVIPPKCSGFLKFDKINVLSLPDNYLNNNGLTTTLCKKVPFKKGDFQKVVNVCKLCRLVSVTVFRLAHHVRIENDRPMYKKEHSTYRGEIQSKQKN